MIFLTQTDFKAVCDDMTLNVINQADSSNLDRAENYALEEIRSYLQGRYDMAAVYIQTGEERNQQIVMYACDIVLYHLVAWLPKRIGFEIRELRYNRAIQWLKDVQAGKSNPSLPPKTDETGNETGSPIRYGGGDKNKYDW